MPGEYQFGAEGEAGRQKKTCYDILGVSPSATQDEIKNAFRKKAKESHPDKPVNKGKEGLFREATEAYEILNDPAKRKKYDDLLASQAFHKEPKNEGFKSEQAWEKEPKTNYQEPRQQKQQPPAPDFAERFKQAYDKRKKQGEDWEDKLNEIFGRKKQ